MIRIENLQDLSAPLLPSTKDKLLIPSGTKQEGRLKATTVPAERRSSLHISSPRTTDSGTYFCAAAARCSPGTCGLYRNHPGAQPLLQPQSHREAPTGHLQSLMLVSYVRTVLTTDTFWPYRLWTLVFIFPSQHVSTSALETSNRERAE